MRRFALRLPISALAPLAAAVLAFAPGGASAGGIVPCQAPFTFEGSAANIVPLEYIATAADRDADGFPLNKELQLAAQRLAWLIKLDSWHQPTYGSLGVVSHIFQGEICEADEVLQRLLAGGGGPPLREGQILVFLHGKIFIEDGEIFLQSRIRAFRRNPREMDFDAPLDAHFERERLSAEILGSEQPLEAALPVLDVTFAPRRMSQELFDRIESVFAEANRIHEEPDAASASEPLDFHAGAPRAFTVQLLDREGWIYVEDIFGGSPDRGYIRTDPGASGFFHDSLPELDFLNGLLGLLRLQQSVAGSGGYPPAPRSTARLAEASFARFLDNEATQGEREARALAWAATGFLAAAGEEDWQRARDALLRAAELSPSTAAYRNLLGVVDAALCCGREDPATGYRDPARWFADSLSLAPEQGEGLANLHAFLEALATRNAPPEGLGVESLDKRLDAVREVVENNPDLVIKD